MAVELDQLLQAVARVVGAATEYAEVEDFAALEEGPAEVVHEGFHVRWNGDRNTFGLADHPDHELQTRHELVVRVGKQYFPGTDDDGVPLRRKIRRELATQLRQTIRGALLTTDDNDLAEALVAYVASRWVAAAPRSWALLDVVFTFTVTETIDVVPS